MRSLLPALVALGAASLACAAPRPEPEDWLEAGFRTPAQAFRTYRTALAGDQPALEYRSLSADFKRREGLTQLAYREFRERLFREEPWLGSLARARVTDEIELGPGRRRLVAEVSVLFWHEVFAVDLVREGFYELWSGDTLLDDGYAPFRELASDAPAVGGLVLTLPLPASEPFETVTEARAGEEWKIDGFVDLPEP
jgi:hypothetical protein